jgi:hypothetical protein
MQSACLKRAKREVVFSHHAYRTTLASITVDDVGELAEGFLNGLPVGKTLPKLAPNYRVCFASPLARIPDRFSKHGVKLALGEFLGLPRYWLACGHHLIRRASTGGQQRCSSLRHRHDLWVSGRWLVIALQAQTS